MSFALASFIYFLMQTQSPSADNACPWTEIASVVLDALGLLVTIALAILANKGLNTLRDHVRTRDYDHAVNVREHLIQLKTVLERVRTVELPKESTAYFLYNDVSDSRQRETWTLEYIKMHIEFSEARGKAVEEKAGFFRSDVLSAEARTWENELVQKMKTLLYLTEVYVSTAHSQHFFETRLKRESATDTYYVLDKLPLDLKIGEDNKIAGSDILSDIAYYRGNMNEIKKNNYTAMIESIFDEVDVALIRKISQG